MSIPLLLNTGAATPGGSNGDIQYNNNGALAGETLVPLAHGGTGVDLSASGSSTAILAQNASHVISARSLVAADIPNLDASKITTGLLLPANAGACNSATASRDCYLLPFGISQIRSSAFRSAMTANTMRVVQFSIERIITFTRVSINVTTTSNGNHEYIGIYDAAGTTLLRQASFTLGAGTGVLTATVSSTTLTPGTYWLGSSPDNGTSVLAGTDTTATQANALFNGGSIVRLGTSSLSTSGGVMPASIGTVSALTSQMPLVLLEP